MKMIDETILKKGSPMNLKKQNEEKLEQLRTSCRKMKAEDLKKYKPTIMVKHPRTGKTMPKEEYLESITISR